MSYTTKCIFYKGGYKYQLRKTYSVVIDFKPESDIVTEYVELDTSGKLTIMKGYAWDGPSGPTIDTKTFLRGSLVHDALYQLIREGYLPVSCKNMADVTLKKICKEDGMWSIRACYVYWGVDKFGKPSIDPSKDKPIETAPGGCDPEII